MTSVLEPIRSFCEQELFERIIPFWERHSVDRIHGGYYTCLDRDGQVYDRTKYVWLQGRQAWMFSKLYRSVEPSPSWLETARLGVDFLLRFALRPDGRAYFSLTEDGRPVALQRKIFSECFTIMALAEYGRAADRQDLRARARDLFESVWVWSSDPSRVGRPRLEGQAPLKPLAIPMILLNLIEELSEDEPGGFHSYSAEIDACIQGVLRHVDTERRLVRENVLEDGSAHDSAEGRLLNPGHAIEAGWFLFHWARRLGRVELERTAVDMIRWSFDHGWDKQHGGLFYFLDTEGFSPVQLEWFMKLWWPHTEALYGTLLAYTTTGDAADLERLNKVTAYTQAHFVDPDYAEWYGYLDREGRVTHRFKGGAYKGCFHVPRSLWLCSRLLSAHLRESGNV